MQVPPLIPSSRLRSSISSSRALLPEIRPQGSRRIFLSRVPFLAMTGLVALLAGSTASLSWADASAAQAQAARAPESDSWGEVGFLGQFESDVDDDGSFDVFGGYARGQFSVRLGEDVRIRTIGSYHGVAYEFDDEPTIAGSELKPWNTIHVARLNPLLDLRLNDRWRIFAGPLLEASLENGGDLTNGLKPGGLVGAEVRIAPTLKLGLGVLGVAEIEDGFYLQPLLLLDWKPTDALSVHAESWTTRGGRFEIAYRAVSWLELAAGVEYRRERFRLKERTISTSPPPPVFRTGSKGIGEDRAVIPSLRISFLPDLTFVRETIGEMRIDVEAGVALAGDLRIEDSDGSQIQTLGYDPAPNLAIRFRIPL